MAVKANVSFEILKKLKEMFYHLRMIFKDPFGIVGLCKGDFLLIFEVFIQRFSVPFLDKWIDRFPISGGCRKKINGMDSPEP
jgi:hypothetical protein